tara:strand:- start:966 stop:1880 length:915 start_codon:yes stop_codon:yes gene_type:complete
MAISHLPDLRGSTFTYGAYDQFKDRAVRRVLVKGLDNDSGDIGDLISHLTGGSGIGYSHIWDSTLKLSRLDITKVGPTMAEVRAHYQREPWSFPNNISNNANFSLRYQPVRVYKKATICPLGNCGKVGDDLDTQYYYGYPDGDMFGYKYLPPTTIEDEVKQRLFLWYNKTGTVYDEESVPQGYMMNRGVMRIDVPVVLEENPAGTVEPFVGSINSENFQVGGITFTPTQLRFDGLDVKWSKQGSTNYYSCSYSFTADPNGHVNQIPTWVPGDPSGDFPTKFPHWDVIYEPSAILKNFNGQFPDS